MKKKIFAVILAVVILSSTAVASAADVQEAADVNPVEYSENDATPRADVIVTKYRVSNGIPQYRRWNETQGYWVDPYWIDLV